MPPRAAGARMPMQAGPVGPYPAAPAPSQAEPARKRGAAFWIAIAVAVVAILAAAVLAFMLLAGDEPSSRDGNALVGQLEGKTDAEVQAELDRIVEEGMFSISIASVAEFERGDAPGSIKIENVPGNRYLMQVDIIRDDTGDVVYRSGTIEPNHYIQEATLIEPLDAGTYECTAIFHALDPETEEEVGQAAAKTEIRVLS